MIKKIGIVFLIIIFLLGAFGCKTSLHEQDASLDSEFKKESEEIVENDIPEESEPDVEKGNGSEASEEPSQNSEKQEKVMQLQVIAPIKKDPVDLSAEDQETVLNILNNAEWKEGASIEFPTLKFFYDGKVYSYLMGGGFYAENGRYMWLGTFEYAAFDEMLKKYIGEVETPFQIPDRDDEMMYVSYNQNDAERVQLSKEDKTKVLLLLNSCEWKEDSVDLFTDLLLYVGESCYSYDSQEGIASIGHTAPRHVNLDEKTAKLVNEILNRYLESAS